MKRFGILLLIGAIMCSAVGCGGEREPETTTEQVMAVHQGGYGSFAMSVNVSNIKVSEVVEEEKEEKFVPYSAKESDFDIYINSWEGYHLGYIEEEDSVYIWNEEMTRPYVAQEITKSNKYPGNWSFVPGKNYAETNGAPSFKYTETIPYTDNVIICPCLLEKNEKEVFCIVFIHDFSDIVKESGRYVFKGGKTEFYDYSFNVDDYKKPKTEEAAAETSNKTEDTVETKETVEATEEATKTAEESDVFYDIKTFKKVKENMSPLYEGKILYATDAVIQLTDKATALLPGELEISGDTVKFTPIKDYKDDWNKEYIIFIGDNGSFSLKKVSSAEEKNGTITYTIDADADVDSSEVIAAMAM